MEALSPTMEEGRLVKWLKAEGDTVKSGDVLAEVETDKAVMELTARGDGILRKQLLAEGNSAPVGTLLAVIGAADEDIAALAATAGAPKTNGGPGATSGQSQRADPSASSAVRSPAPPPEQSASSVVRSPAPPAEQSASSVPRKSSPLARRLAAESGIDLAVVAGSGPGGRVIKRDIEAAEKSGAAIVGAPLAPARERVGDHEDIPLTQIRKTIAKRLVESIGPIPTFYLTAEFDMERVAEMRTAMAELGDEYKVSFNDIVMKAVATTLAQHPECNAHWMGDRIRQFNRVHLGMAVATDDGLIVPVIFDADSKPLRQIARESRELAKRARDRKLTPEEYTGSTFSVSNLGMFGIDQFTAIINPPEAGIIAIGAIEEKPAQGTNGVEFRRRMRITMSCDHRIIDGAAGARFLQTLRRMIENPLLLVY
jgi:pyruvate dehydrogenase E2 component (dihydrolipoamide acetyltransferase)